MELASPAVLGLGFAVVVQLILFAFGYGLLWAEVRNLRKIVIKLEDILETQVLEYMSHTIAELKIDVSVLKERCKREHG